MHEFQVPRGPRDSARPTGHMLQTPQTLLPPCSQRRKLTLRVGGGL